MGAPPKVCRTLKGFRRVSSGLTRLSYYRSTAGIMRAVAKSHKVSPSVTGESFLLGAVIGFDVFIQEGN